MLSNLLDVSCFSPSKHFYRIDLATVSSRFGIKTANKFTVANVFELAIEFGCSPENIKSGFRRCGLYPFDVNWPSHNKELFHMAEELDLESRKRKPKRADPNELPWEDVHKGMQGCEEAVSAILNDNNAQDLPTTLIEKLTKAKSQMKKVCIPQCERLLTFFQCQLVKRLMPPGNLQKGTR
jgi:hypothetical protein